MVNICLGNLQGNNVIHKKFKTVEPNNPRFTMTWLGTKSMRKIQHTSFNRHQILYIP